MSDLRCKKKSYISLQQQLYQKIYNRKLLWFAVSFVVIGYIMARDLLETSYAMGSRFELLNTSKLYFQETNNFDYSNLVEINFDSYSRNYRAISGSDGKLLGNITLNQLSFGEWKIRDKDRILSHGTLSIQFNNVKYDLFPRNNMAFIEKLDFADAGFLQLTFRLQRETELFYIHYSYLSGVISVRKDQLDGVVILEATRKHFLWGVIYYLNLTKVEAKDRLFFVNAFIGVHHIKIY